MRIVFDTEADGLLRQATRMWIFAWRDIDTNASGYFLEGDLGWKTLLDKCTLIIGHNIIGYDLGLLKKLFNYDLPSTCNIHDTLILSQVLDYKRFGEQGHQMSTWGTYLGTPKQEHEDWSQYSEEMKTRCISDVTINCRMYDQLIDEVRQLAEKNHLIKPYLRAEHAVAKWQMLGSVHGWPFDLEGAKKLNVIFEAELKSATEQLEHKLGFKSVAEDKKKGVVEVKYPKWVKNGFYNSHTANWFGIDVESGFAGEERMVDGPYCRVSVEPLLLTSTFDVKIFLFRQGWVPDTYNTKWNPETRKNEKTTPKITPESIEFLGEDGLLYKEYLTTKSRNDILKGMIEATDENNMLHGDCRTIGTPSMRMTHATIVNIPSSDSKWGKEMRMLFQCLPGWRLIGCDSASNQARGLAHYLNNADFTDILLNGDVHTFNAEAIDAALKTMDINWDEYIVKSGKAQPKKKIDKFLTKHNIPKEAYLKRGSKYALKAIAAVKRAAAKRILYAFLFGAGGDKLWSYIFGTMNATLGNKFKREFQKRVPGYVELQTTLENVYGATKKRGAGYIPSIAGNRVYVDSFHKLLVYLLQSLEKVTCSAAVMLIMERLTEAGIPFIPCIMMHDEADFMVPAQFAEQAAEIGKSCFKDGPKLFGVNIMDGSKKIGGDWYDIH
jgi:DNA polymerase-1